jgi:hypothetical protein
VKIRVTILCFLFAFAGYGLRTLKNQVVTKAERLQKSSLLVSSQEKIQWPDSTSDEPSRMNQWRTLCAQASKRGYWQRLMRRAKGDSAVESLIVEQWARKNPAECWAYLVDSADDWYPQKDLAYIVAKIWAVTDPEAAMRAMADLPCRNEFRDEIRWFAFREALLHDSDRAIKLINLTMDANRISWGESEKWVEANPEKACRLLASLPDCMFRSGIAQAAREWLKKDQDAALEFVKNLAPGPQRMAAMLIGRDFGANGDFAAARELAESARSMALRSAIASSFMRRWAGEEPAKAVEWVAEHFTGDILGERLSQATRFAAYEVISRSNKGAYDMSPILALADAQPVGIARDGAASGILETWGKSQPGEAFAWFYERAQRGELTDRALSSLADNFGGGPVEWYETAPEHPFVEEAFSYALRREEAKGAEALRKWAATLPPVRSERVERVVARLAEGE